MKNFNSLMHKFFISLPLFFLTLTCFGQLDHYETIVYENDEWSYIMGTSEPDPNWNALSFNDENWERGIGGFGYGDNDDNTTIAATISFYMRKEFEILDRQKIIELFLDIDYDDAFVAYLNGVEIARSGLTGTPPGFAQLGVNHEALIKDGLPPERFQIGMEILAEVLLEGNNVIAIQAHNASQNSSDFTIRPFLSAGIAGNDMIYGETHPYFETPLNFESSNLPIFMIDTENNASIPDEPKIKAHMSIIHNNDGAINSISDNPGVYDGEIGIEIRGSYSAILPQKPYGIETRDAEGKNNNVPLFHMPEENDWILLANYNDKVLMRNVLSFHLFNEMGHYAPRTQFCELLLNGNYQGIYVFTEKIKQDENRINISKLSPDENSGDDLTGGYIFKNDYYEADGSDSWLGGYSPESLPDKTVRFVYHDPQAEEISYEQKQYLKSYISNFENVLFGSNYKNPETGYRAYIDVSSFIDYLIISELSRNVDAYKKSKFYFKDKESKGGELHSGPVWDFDWSYKNLYGEGVDGSGWAHISYSYMYPTPNGWIERLLKDPWFEARVGDRYHSLRSTILSDEYLFTFVDDRHTLLDQAANRHYQKWPILGINVGAPEGNEWQPQSYEGEIQKFKNWIKIRLEWLDDNMPEAGLSPVNDLDDDALSIRLFPNPSQNEIYIESSEQIENIKIISSTRNQVMVFNQNLSKLNKIPIDNLPKGLYFVQIQIQSYQPRVIRFVKN